MDIGTGKDLGDYGRVPYHLIDVVSPKKQFTVAEYQRRAYRAIDDILKRGRLPIVCGGTGLYVTALTEGYVLPQNQKSKIKNQKLRKKLEKLNLEQLLGKLKKVDPATYMVVDKKNRRRVQRALEIYYLTGRSKSEQAGKQKPAYRFLLLGLTLPKPALYRRIQGRLQQRLDQGLVEEVERLHRQGGSWWPDDDLCLP